MGIEGQETTTALQQHGWLQFPHWHHLGVANSGSQPSKPVRTSDSRELWMDHSAFTPAQGQHCCTELIVRWLNKQGSHWRPHILNVGAVMCSTVELCAYS